MKASKEQLEQMYKSDRFPRSSRYDVQWAIENEMGPNALWLTEALCEVMDLKPGMRVLDLGCGKAISSIFLAKEFGVQVWATDLWIPASENWTRIREAGMEDSVFPIHAEARALPYADEFFDAIVSMDAYHYFGTDVHYLDFHLLKLLKTGGQIGIVSPASPQEPEHPIDLQPSKVWYWWNSVDWWRKHWERFPGVEVEVAEPLPGGWEQWVLWGEILEAEGGSSRPPEALDNAEELRIVKEDGGRIFGFVRMTARKK